MTTSPDTVNVAKAQPRVSRPDLDDEPNSTFQRFLVGLFVAIPLVALLVAIPLL